MQCICHLDEDWSLVKSSEATQYPGLKSASACDITGLRKLHKYVSFLIVLDKTLFIYIYRWLYIQPKIEVTRDIFLKIVIAKPFFHVPEYTTSPWE